MRLGAVSLVALALVVGPVLIGCGGSGSAGGKKTEPSATANIPKGLLTPPPGVRGGPNAPFKR